MVTTLQVVESQGCPRTCSSSSWSSPCGCTPTWSSWSCRPPCTPSCSAHTACPAALWHPGVFGSWGTRPPPQPTGELSLYLATFTPEFSHTTIIRLVFFTHMSMLWDKLGGCLFFSYFQIQAENFDPRSFQPRTQWIGYMVKHPINSSKFQGVACCFFFFGLLVSILECFFIQKRQERNQYFFECTRGKS